MRSFLIVFILNFLTSIVYGQDNSTFFVKNKGQWKSSALAKADLPSGALFLEDDALVFNFIDQSKINSIHDSLQIQDQIGAHSFRWKFIKSKAKEVVFSDQLGGTINYYNSKNTASNLSRFHKATYKEIYSNIDYQMYGFGDGLKYDWIVRPGGKAKNIQMELFGVKDVSIKDGRLHITTLVNYVLEEKPYAYQMIDGKKQEVKCAFVWQKNRLSFSFPEGYDKEKELVIDPIIVFSTFSGSTANNFGFTATYDDYGFLYAGGVAFNVGYPTTLGTYEINYSGGILGTDIVLSKYDTTGSFLVYSTYLGGAGDEVPHSLIVYEEELFMMGTTGSADYPTTTNCMDSTFNGGPALNQGGVSINYNNGCDIVVSRLSADGSQLLASTFVGGTDNDGFNTANSLRFNYADQMRGEIDIDSQGNCFIASSTLSSDFPIVNSLVQPLNNGEQDGVVIKMDLDLSQIQWSTYWGGSSDDAIYSLAFDNEDNIYVSGGTSSDNLLTTAGAYKTAYQGGIADAFITKFSNDGSEVLKSTFFGTAEYDQSYFIELDNEGQVYIFGQSLDTNDILIDNADFNQSKSGQFVAKLNDNLNSQLFSTLFGSGRSEIDIVPTAFLVDACNRVYCSGWGGATNSIQNGGPGGHTAGLITTDDAFQSDTDSSDFYIIIFEDNGNTLSYASFFGGNQAAEHVDGGTSRFDKKGVIYQSVCAGCGGTSDFPTTDEAFSSVNNSGCNNAVFKFDPQFPLTVSNFNAPDIVCDNIVEFENISQGVNNTYEWDFGDGAVSTEVNPSHEFLVDGEYTITLYSLNSLSCNLIDSISKNVTVRSDTYIERDSLLLCYGDSVQLNVVQNEDYDYYWLPNTYLQTPLDINTIAIPEVTTTYLLIGVINECADTLEQTIVVDDIGLSFKSNYEICGDTIELIATSSLNSIIEWSQDPTFSEVLMQSTLVTSQVGSYYVRAKLGQCSRNGVVTVDFSLDCCSEDNLQIPNAFTANGDGINEYFLIKDSKNIIQDFDLQIFNRWGQKVFFSQDKTQSWDGFFKGALQPSSVFDYHLSIGCIENKGEFFKKGNITLIR